MGEDGQEQYSGILLEVDVEAGNLEYFGKYDIPDIRVVFLSFPTLFMISTC